MKLDLNSLLLVFRVYERSVVIDSLNLKLRQIARLSSNVISDDMSSAKYCLPFLMAQHEERSIYHAHVVTSGFLVGLIIHQCLCIEVN